jgi:hypothetical protein
MSPLAATTATALVTATTFERHSTDSTTTAANTATSTATNTTPLHLRRINPFLKPRGVQ